MTCFGNRKPPYLLEGIASSTATIRRECRKLQAMLGELDESWERAMALAEVERIAEGIWKVERMGKPIKEIER